MGVKLQKPILVIGVGLSVLLWLGQSIQGVWLLVCEWGLLSLLAIGAGVWFCDRPKPTLKSFKLPPLKREAIDNLLAQVQKTIEHIETEAPSLEITALKTNLAQLPGFFERETIRVAVAGEHNVGKTTLCKLLSTENFSARVEFRETKIFDNQADLILFITSGDLTDSQWQTLQTYQASYQHFLILFNKQDQYVPEERALILAQIRQRLESLAFPTEVVAITAAPQAIRVRRHQIDNTVEESLEPQSPDLTSLLPRLNEIIREQKPEMLLGTIWREVMVLKQQAEKILNQVRREKAIPIIEQYQWIAAGTALANPVAALDVLATVAINAQMLVDLGSVYQQQLSLKQAETIAKTLGKLMVKLGLVELSTQAIASLLKTNAVTYLAGGAVQGVSAAYLTRIAGLSIVEYFQEQNTAVKGREAINLEKLSNKLKQVFDQNQRTSFLQQLSANFGEFATRIPKVNSLSNP